MPTTIDDSLLKRLMRDAEDGRKARRKGLLEREGASTALIKSGQVKEGLLGVAGANAPLFTSVLAGGGLMWLALSPYAAKMEIFAKNWWLRGLIVLAGGFILFRRQSSWAQAVLAAGAAIFVKDWESRPDAKKESSGPGDEDAGYWWEGRWHEPRWERDRERERDLPRRRWEELPEGVRAAERMADRVFEGARREF